LETFLNRSIIDCREVVIAKPPGWQASYHKLRLQAIAARQKARFSKQALWPSKFLPGAHISESELQVSSLQAQQVSARRTMTREIMSLSRNLVVWRRSVGSICQ
jgi:hypothetical protein